MPSAIRLLQMKIGPPFKIMMERKLVADMKQGEYPQKGSSQCPEPSTGSFCAPQRLAHCCGGPAIEQHPKLLGPLQVCYTIPWNQ